MTALGGLIRGAGLIMCVAITVQVLTTADDELAISLKVSGKTRPSGTLNELVNHRVTTGESLDLHTTSSTHGRTTSKDGIPGRIRAASISDPLTEETTRKTMISSSQSSSSSSSSAFSSPTKTPKGQTSTQQESGTTETTEISDKDTAGNIPPHILEPATNEMVIMHEKTREICCKADGFPKPTITWYRNKEIVTSQDQNVRDDGKGCLVLEQFSARWNGWFQCRAKNMYGVCLSHMFNIAYRMKPYQDGKFISNEVHVAQAGKPFELKCGDLPASLPEMERRWYTDHTRQLVLSERVCNDKKGQLHFAYVDDSDNRKYICGLWGEGSLTSIELYARGSIKVIGDINLAPDLRPVIQYSTRYVEAVIGQNIILECFFVGKPIPTIQWKNTSNHVITTNSKYMLGYYGLRRLTIKNIVQSDNGTYTCTGSNLKETVPEALQVVVIAPPMGVRGQILSPTTVPDGGYVTLSCKTWTAKGLTNNPPIWYRNGDLLYDRNVPNPSRYKFSSDRTQLFITGLDKQIDTAAYQCNTTNSVGYLYMYGYLRVIDSIEITDSPPDVVIVDPDTDRMIDLTVFSRGDHCCPINHYWTHNGTEARLNQLPLIYDSATRRLHLNVTSVDTMSLYDALGQYVCRVSNLYQMVNVTFNVAMKGHVEFQRAATSGFQLWWLGIIFGVLAILITILVVIVLKKSNYPRSTYLLEKTELKHNLNPQEDLLNQSFQEL